MANGITESEVLRNAVGELEEAGYAVFVEPRPPILPSFLKDIRPDAIARRHDKNILIEVVRTRSAHESRLEKIAAAVREHPDWELRVIAIDSVGRSAGLAKQSSEAIEAALREVGGLIKEGFNRPALLAAWSTFEAIARAIMPTDFARPQSPGRLVQILAQEGYITPTEADVLRDLANKRNVLIHGNVVTDISRADLEKFVAVLAKLKEMAPA